MICDLCGRPEDSHVCTSDVTKLLGEVSQLKLQLSDMTKDRDAWSAKETATSHRLVEALLKEQDMNRLNGEMQKALRDLWVLHTNGSINGHSTCRMCQIFNATKTDKQSTEQHTNVNVTKPPLMPGKPAPYSDKRKCEHKMDSDCRGNAWCTVCGATL